MTKDAPAQPNSNDAVQSAQSNSSGQPRKRKRAQNFEDGQRKRHEGLLQVIAQGAYLSNVAPFGYQKHVIGTKKSLAPNKYAPLVKKWFERVSNREATCETLAREANAERIPTHTGVPWSARTVRTILRNPAYKGWVRWGYYKTVTSDDNSSDTTKERVKNENPTMVQGLHEAIVSEELWEAANAVLDEAATNFNPYAVALKHPLAGLLRCRDCGRMMERNVNAHGRTFIKHSKINRNECWQSGAPLKTVMETLSETLYLLAAQIQVKITPENAPEAEDLFETVSHAARAVANFESNPNSAPEIHSLLTQFIKTIDYDKEGVESYMHLTIELIPEIPGLPTSITSVEVPEESFEDE